VRFKEKDVERWIARKEKNGRTKRKIDIYFQ